MRTLAPICNWRPRALGPLCPWHRLTGLWCPGCGATRATVALARGRPRAAVRLNALWVALLPGAAYAVTLRLGNAAEVALPRPAWGRRHDVALLAAVAMFAVARNLPYRPFRYLAPPPAPCDTASSVRLPGLRVRGQLRHAGRQRPVDDVAQ